MSKNDSENGINYGLIILMAILAAVVSSFITYKATAGNAQRIAVVDLQRVILASKDVAALKVTRDNQIQSLKMMADDANNKIKEEKNESARKKMSEEYLNRINAQKENYDKLYASALQASDQKLNDTIKAVAQKEGLNVVVNKASVIEGGIDITDSVIDLVK